MQTSNRKGFTLIELLIVVVIIGILAAIAIPKFANTKDKAYVASMKADLKNLVNVQESFFADNNKYGATADLTGKYSVSQGNVMGAITGNATGWSATVTNPAVKSAGTQTCGIFAGDAAPPNAAVTSEGAPACY